MKELHYLAEDCNFGMTLVAISKYRLVCEVRDERLQCRLLSEKTFPWLKQKNSVYQIKTVYYGVIGL